MAKRSNSDRAPRPKGTTRPGESSGRTYSGGIRSAESAEGSRPRKWTTSSLAEAGEATTLRTCRDFATAATAGRLPELTGDSGDVPAADGVVSDELREVARVLGLTPAAALGLARLPLILPPASQAGGGSPAPGSPPPPPGSQVEPTTPAPLGAARADGASTDPPPPAVGEFADRVAEQVAEVRQAVADTSALIGKLRRHPGRPRNRWVVWLAVRTLQWRARHKFSTRLLRLLAALRCPRPRPPTNPGA